MEIISAIMSGLALLAATSCLFITVMEKKRSEKRNAALMQYADEGDKELAEKLEALEKGIVPDYEKARAAADAVNDFNKGISNLLNFDPMAALQAERQKERTGGEAE